MDNKSFINGIINKTSAIIVIVIIIWSIFAVRGVWKEQILIKEKELLIAATEVSKQVHRNFDIIQIHKERDFTDNEKVLAVNAVLQKHIQQISQNYPELGMGYYDMELDSIAAIAPNFDPSMLQYVSREYPYFKCYETGKPEFFYHNTSIGWNGKSIFNVTIPIYFGDEIIGHTWANDTTEDLYMHAAIEAGKVLLFGLAVWLGVLFIFRRIVGRSLDTLNRFVEHIMQEKHDQMFVDIPEMRPVLAKIEQYTEELKELNNQLKVEAREREASEAHYKTIFENTRFGIITSHIDGTIIKANKALLNIIGYDEQELMGKSWMEITHPDDLEEKFSYYKDLKAGLIDYFEMEKRYIRKDGGVIWVHITVVGPQEGDNGIVTAFIQDITEKKVFQDNIVKYDRLNMLGEMAAGVSHEVRNPMTTVRGFLQILKAKPECSPYTGHIDLMIEELDRANTIYRVFGNR